MTQQAFDMRAIAQAMTLLDGLTEEPDCLAELEYTYSVFRFRYEWGTVFEVTVSNLADAYDRQACLALMPTQHVFIESVDTNTLGVGMNGITREVTSRFVASYF